jgi:predicted metal-binding transcription factor (methanogenesis marker protein 9)
MNTTENIVKCLNDKLSKYKQPVTELSKTDEGNDFIINDTIMLDWDEVSKFYDGDDSSSVDAVYCSFKNNELTLYFFEFKKLDLYDEHFDAKKGLENYLLKIDEDGECSKYTKQIRKLKKKLISKKVVSLKTKPIESLILLHKVLHELGISPEEIISIKKEYYIVSKTEMKVNRSNFYNSGRSGELFGFINRIKPFPFVNVEPINEEIFIELIEDLKRNN